MNCLIFKFFVNLIFLFQFWNNFMFMSNNISHLNIKQADREKVGICSDLSFKFVVYHMKFTVSFQRKVLKKHH